MLDEWNDGTNAQEVDMVRKKTTGARSKGRPPVLEDAWKKVTVILLQRQIVWLDRVALDIRVSQAKTISRAELIRAMIDAAAESGSNLAEAGSEEELKRLLLSKLGPKERSRSN